MLHGMPSQIPLTRHSRPLLENREAVLAEAVRCGLENVRVIGSMARGDATEDSDVDLLVSVVPDKQVGLRRYHFTETVRELIGRSVDIRTDAQLKPRPGELPTQAMIREAILDDATPL